MRKTKGSRSIRTLLCGLLAGACGGTAAPATPVPAQTGRDSTLVREAMAGNRIEGPVQIVFAWSLRERDARFSGEGVTRVAPPDRARLDLFGPRGEGYLSAAFVEGEVVLPPGAPSTPLPPPPLMWSALGVFEPPPSSTLVAVRPDGDRLELEYAAGEERWRYHFEAGRLRNVEWTAPRGGRRTVELEGTGPLDLPRAAVYRDWPQFVELRMTLEEAHSVDGFSAEIWSVGR